MRAARPRRPVWPLCHGALLLILAASPTVARAELLFQAQPATRLGTQPCGGGGCWTNYARVTDFDGDGDLDLVAVNTGGFFSTPVPQPLTLYENDGAGSFSDASPSIGNFVGGVRQVAFGDADGDGDVDLYVPAAGGAQADALFIRTGGSFVNEASSRLPSGLASDAGAARFGDLDGDGDLDLLVADGYLNDGDVPAHLYENDGAGHFVEAFTLPTTGPTGAVNVDDFDLVDVDGDFDLDVYLSFHSGPNALWMNDGSGALTVAPVALPPLDPGANYHYGPVACDVDGDGDRDLVVDNTASQYQEQLLINAGNGTFTDETSARIVDNVVNADDNLVVCFDYDGDGDFDLGVGALNPGNERVFSNDGTGHFDDVVDAFDGGTDPTLWMELGDLNGDGRLDVFTAQGEGTPELERLYFGTAAVAVDVRAPNVFATEVKTLSSAASTPVRFAVSDGAITDEGPRLTRAWVEVDGASIPARFIGGDIFRALVPATSATSFVACAEDLAGNVSAGCEGSAGQGGSGAGGAGPGATGVTSASGGPSGGGDGGGGGSDGGGCSCSAAGRGPTAGDLAGLVLAGVAVAARNWRRRR